MSDAVDLSEVLLNAPPECWAALNEEQTRIVGTGKTMEEALTQARKNGVEDPILHWVPSSWKAHIFIF